MKKLSAIFVNMQEPLKKDNLRFIEISLFGFIWLILFISPIIIQSEKDVFKWEYVYDIWKKLLPFYILSGLNHFVLVPFIFFRRNKAVYLLSSFLTIITFSLVLSIVHKKPGIEQDPGRRVQPHPREHSFNQAPPPRRPNPGQHPPHDTRRQPPRPFGGLPPFLNTTIVAFLVIGADTGLRTVFKWTKSEQDKAAIEKERVKSELAFLRTQVSPHFFMNTLNNIHALIEYNKDDAKDSVIRLSKMMRYLLYESDRDPTSLSKEIDFISNYIELNKLRITDKVKLTVDLPDNIPDFTVFPLIFVTFIENSFKYGISNIEDSFIYLNLRCEEEFIYFRLSNSNHLNPEKQSEYSGIGLENTKKRLDLLYGTNHELTITNDSKAFHVELKLYGYADQMSRH